MVRRSVETFAIEILPLKITHSVRLSISRRYGDTVQGMDRRARIALYALLSCFALTDFAWTASAAYGRSNEGRVHDERTQQRLGVIIPTYRGDLDRAVSSLGRWPKICSPLTQENVDLVLNYYVEEDDTTAAAAITTVANSAGRCFARTRLVYANLVDQVRTTGRKRQFFFFREPLSWGGGALGGFESHSVMADVPQRARLPTPLTATQLSCLVITKRIFPYHPCSLSPLSASSTL